VFGSKILGRAGRSEKIMYEVEKSSGMEVK
jgi:hypothetical protein